MCVCVSDDSQSSTIQLYSTQKEGFIPNMTLWMVLKLCIYVYVLYINKYVCMYIE